MTPSVLEQGLPWDWDSFPSFLDALDKRLGINMACYVGHSALRRFVMGEAASERAANADELARMQQLVREAMHAGAAGFSISLAPTHVDQFNQPVPSRHAHVRRSARADRGRRRRRRRQHLLPARDRRARPRRATIARA